jgi:hypothetical protein
MISGLVAQPIALVMAFLAVLLVLVSVNSGTQPARRVLLIAIAIISGLAAWMMATGWSWPSSWPRFLR